MARPNLETNPKFKLLVRKLKLPKPYVRGLLETIWDSAHADGNPIFRNEDEVEAAAEWPGEPGLFVSAMLDCVFLEKTLKGSIGIHDYWDHVPDYVWDRKRKELERSGRKASKEEIRLEFSALFRNCPEKSRTSSDNSGEVQNNPEKSVTPAPAPAPAHLLNTSSTIVGDSGEKSPSTESFEKEIDHCPHREIIDAWKEVMPELTQVRIWGDKSKSALRARWREDPKRQSVDWWKKLFRHLRLSDFLMGRSKTPFTLTLGWVVLASNFEKIANGMYHRKPESQQPSGQLAGSSFEG